MNKYLFSKFILFLIASVAAIVVGGFFPEILLFWGGVGLIYFSWISKNQGIPYSENVVLIFGFLIYLILLMYHFMFEIINVSLFVLNASDDQRLDILREGFIFFNSLLLGGFLSLAMDSRYVTYEVEKKGYLSDSVVNMLFVIALMPLLISGLAYYLYFHGRDYVDLHINGGGLPGLALKLVYFSYAVVLIFGIFPGDVKGLGKKLLWITLGFVFVYGVLYKLRSPLMFYLLLLFFLFGRKLNFSKIMVLGVFVAVALSGVALVRDDSLVNEGVGKGLLTMIMGLGEQANSMIFAGDYVEESGPLWGMGLMNGFFGFAEPLTNEYARQIAPEYFEAGGGFGFFVVSDIILNFGKIFGLIVIFSCGYFLMRVRRDRSRFFEIALIAVIYANAFSLIRNDFGSTFRASMYTMASVFLIKILFKLNLKFK